MLCSLGPSAAPSNLRIKSVTTSSVTLVWESPDILTWNGWFFNYKISYKSASGESTSSSISPITSITVSQLVFGTFYSFYVAFAGSGGVGPAANLSILTLQEGEFVKI